MLCKRMAMSLGALVMLTTTPSWAVVIGDFEGTTDGWAPSFGENRTALFPDNTPGYGGFFATSGSYALNVLSPDLTSNPPAGAFRWSMGIGTGQIPNLVELFVNNPILQADIGWRTDEWSADADGVWARWDTAAINNSVTGFRQTTDSDMVDTVNPSFPGSWDKNSFGAEHKRTVRWDFRGKVSSEEFARIAAESTWFEINISTNYDSLFNTAGGSFWIDNIQLLPVPEPTSLAMAAMIGVLPVIRRRFGRS